MSRDGLSKILGRKMKTRMRFIRIVIAATVIILLLLRFVGKWRYSVATAPFMEVNSISMPSEQELVCRILVGCVC